MFPLIVRHYKIASVQFSSLVAKSGRPAQQMGFPWDQDGWMGVGMSTANIFMSGGSWIERTN